MFSNFLNWNFFNKKREENRMLAIELNGRLYIFPWDMKPVDAIRTILSENAFQSKRIDLFQTRDNLTSEINIDASNCCQFKSNLLKSNRSEQYMHGANLLPWLYSWINSYLSSQDRTFALLNKMRFQKLVDGDLNYTITPIEDTSRKAHAHVWGCFTDDKGGKYWFYGNNEAQLLYRPFTTQNSLYPNLLNGHSVSWEDQISQESPYPLTIRLQNLSRKPEIWTYIDTMEAEPWFFWATLIDMATKLFQEKTWESWVMISYEDFILRPDFTIEKFLDWSCVLRLTPVELNRTTKITWFWNKLQFDLMHEGQSLASWTFITSRSNKVSET